MLSWDPNPYNLRSRKKRKATILETGTIHHHQAKRLRYTDYITNLPLEIILHIFSFLQIEELYFNVRPVCSAWCHIAMLAAPWRKIDVGKALPTHILLKWLELSPVITELSLSNRNDGDAILAQVAKSAPNLESLTISNCWGAPNKVVINSNSLCGALNRCKKLGMINFDRVHVRSCKFFKLLAKRGNECRLLRLHYVGPISNKQYQALKEYCSGWVFTEFMGGAVN